METQIENAVEGLSEEDLESEVDEETLLNIVSGEIDSFDSLTSRDLKIAVGEEVQELEEEVVQESSEPLEEILEEEIVDDIPEEEVETVDGVEALKNLLTALTDKNVAASMKGMKISINITLGDN